MGFRLKDKGVQEPRQPPSNLPGFYPHGKEPGYYPAAAGVQKPPPPPPPMKPEDFPPPVPYEPPPPPVGGFPHFNGVYPAQDDLPPLPVKNTPQPFRLK